MIVFIVFAVVIVLLGVGGFLAWWFLWRTPKIRRLGARFECWYGRVNTWASNKKLLKKDVKACRRHGVAGYHIELAGWADGDAWSPRWLDNVEEKYHYLLGLCRRNGLRLFVSIINDNMGQGKYGDKGPSLQAAWPQAVRLIDIVARGGHRNVVVQPVGETQSSAGPRFEAECLGRLGPKFAFVYNGGVGRPASKPAPYAYRAWHPVKKTDKVPSDAIAVSDTGSIIRQLGVGLDGPAHPDTLETWARFVRSSGCPVCVYYAFQFKGHDEKAIKALGRATK